MEEGCIKAKRWYLMKQRKMGGDSGGAGRGGWLRGPHLSSHLTWKCMKCIMEIVWLGKRSPQFRWNLSLFLQTHLCGCSLNVSLSIQQLNKILLVVLWVKWHQSRIARSLSVGSTPFDCYGRQPFLREADLVQHSSGRMDICLSVRIFCTSSLTLSGFKWLHGSEL